MKPSGDALVEFHDYANIFPLLPAIELETLAADIKANGLLETIVIYENKILDGRNRFLACRLAGIEPVFSPYTGDSPLAFVVSKNVHRRHLTASQAAAVALDVLPMLAAEARERQRQAGKLYGENHPKELVSNLTQALTDNNPANGKSRDAAAALFNTSAGYISYAGRLRESAPELFADVRAGTVNIREARDIAKLSPEKQDRIRAKINDGMNSKKAVREVEKEVQAETVHTIKSDWLFVGDLAEVGSRISDNSVNVIFTDPPYDEGSIKLYGELAKLAARVLKPGGICLAYSGQMFIPQIIPIMSAHLEYMWLCGIGHAGGPTWFRKWHLDNQWKPVLMYGKPPIIPYWDKFDDFVTGGKEKSHHPWQQAVAEAEHYLMAVCPPGGVVLDPFLGSGTTVLAAKNLGLQYCGIEKKSETAKMALERIGSN